MRFLTSIRRRPVVSFLIIRLRIWGQEFEISSGAPWHIRYAGVRVGVISERSGAPPSSNQWEWHCGFYPGSNPGDQRYGTAATFDDARAAFQAAWRDYLPNRTESDFDEWRQDAAWHACKIRALGSARWQNDFIGSASPIKISPFHAMCVKVAR